MNVHSLKRKASASAGARRKKPVRADGRGRPVSGDKHRELLDAGLRTFAARGYHGTSVPDVAEAGGMAVGTVYRYFANKDALVNEVYRDAKERLRRAVFEPPLPSLDSYDAGAAQTWFMALWTRLGAFADAEPEAFRFLEMQDHSPYLDAKSRAVELAILAPLVAAGRQLHTWLGKPVAPIETLIALLWGSFVGLVKAGRLGYFKVDDKAFAQAGLACWQMIVPPPSRAADGTKARARSKGTP